ncbi:MAG: ABC transporter substrate-binding protein [Actinomycetota bacterium]
MTRAPRRRSGVTVCGAVALALLTSSCVGTGEAPQQQGSASGPVSVLLWAEPEELPAYREVIRAFGEVEPDIEVRLIHTGNRDDLVTRLSTSFAGGTPPDLFLLNYRFIGQYQARGVIEPLGSRLDGSDVFQREDFYPQALEAFTFDGVLTCMPQNVSSLVVYYNVDLFREIGLDGPPERWTFFDMVGLARNLTVDRDGNGAPEQYGLGVEPTVIRMAPFIWSNGGTLVDDEENPTRFTLHEPAAVEVMQSFFDLREEYRVVPTEHEIEAQEDEDRFLNGTTAMLLASRRETPSLRTITDFEWDVAPLPIFQEEVGILHSDAYCMPRQSEHKEPAWRFLEFALGPEGQRITAEAGRTVPSLIEVAESDAFLDPGRPPASSQVFLDTIPTIRRVPNISTWPEIEERTDEVLEIGMYHLVPALDIAQRIIRETTDMFARSG